MARLYRRDGKWGIDYTDARGNRVRELVATDKSVAQAALGRAVAAVEKVRNGLISADPREAKRPVAEHVTEYIAELHRRGRDGMYVYVVEKRLERAIRDIPIAVLVDFTPRTVMRFLSKLTWHGKPLAPQSRNQHLETIRAFLTWAVEDLRLEADPLTAVKPAAEVRERKRRALCEWECRQLLAATPSERRLAYAVLLYTGLRRAEAAKIVWRDLRLEGLAPFIEIRASISKARQDETVPLFMPLVPLLLKARGEPDERVFPRGVPDMTVFREDLARAGIKPEEGGRKVVVHGFRNVLATILASHGVSDAIRTRILRHRPQGLTDGVYTDASALPLREAINRVPNVLAPEVAAVGAKKRATGT